MTGRASMSYVIPHVSAHGQLLHRDLLVMWVSYDLEDTTRLSCVSHLSRTLKPPSKKTTKNYCCIREIHYTDKSAHRERSHLSQQEICPCLQLCERLGRAGSLVLPLWHQLREDPTGNTQVRGGGTEVGMYCLFRLGLQHTSCQVFKCSFPVAQEWLQTSKLE